MKKNIALWLVLITIFASPLYAARVKDIAAIRGGRTNQLIGYSVVIGLNGTGDTPESLLPRKPLVSALERMGIKITENDIRGRSVAAVVVTSTLPPFAKQGQKIDVVVSTLGDAISLRGGVLVMSPLRGPDKETYALAQGLISEIPMGLELPEGLEAIGATKLQKDPNSSALPTVGRVVGGGLVEKEIEIELNTRSTVYLNLFDPDFTNAFRLAKIINNHFGDDTAKASDAGTVEVSVPASYLGQSVELISKIESLNIDPDSAARVVLNERTGTVVITGRVNVQPVAIAHGNLKINIDGLPNGEREKRTEELKKLFEENENPNPELLKLYRLDDMLEDDRVLTLSGGVDLKDLVDGLNKIGVSNRELGEILKLVKTAGALQADLIIQ